MAAMVMQNKKAIEIRNKVLGVQPFMVDKRTKKQKEIDRILTMQNSMKTLYR